MNMTKRLHTSATGSLSGTAIHFGPSTICSRTIRSPLATVSPLLHPSRCRIAPGPSGSQVHFEVRPGPYVRPGPTWEFVFAPKRGAHLIGSRVILDTPLKFKIIMWLRLTCPADYCPRYFISILPFVHDARNPVLSSFVHAARHPRP